MKAEIKPRLPLPKQTEKAFGKARYSRKEKYSKRLDDYLDDAEREEDEMFEDILGELE